MEREIRWIKSDRKPVARGVATGRWLGYPFTVNATQDYTSEK
jgi:hypothetical protein